MFAAACNLELEGIVSKKLDAPYRSGPSKTWIKAKNPKAPAGPRIIEGGF
jgi:bifunctional non-homologous end joining protein LigD